MLIVGTSGIYQHQYVISLISFFSPFELLTGLSLPVQHAGAAETPRITWGLGGMVPLSYESGTVGTGWGRGHRGVCVGNPDSGGFCSSLWMLLQSRQSEPEEEEGWGDLNVWEENWHKLKRMLTRWRICQNLFVHLLVIFQMWWKLEFVFFIAVIL